MCPFRTRRRPSPEPSSTAASEGLPASTRPGSACTASPELALDLLDHRQLAHPRVDARGPDQGRAAIRPVPRRSARARQPPDPQSRIGGASMAREITVEKAICQDVSSNMEVTDAEAEVAAGKRVEPFEIGFFSDYGTLRVVIVGRTNNLAYPAWSRTSATSRCIAWLLWNTEGNSVTLRGRRRLWERITEDVERILEALRRAWCGGRSSPQVPTRGDGVPKVSPGRAQPPLPGRVPPTSSRKHIVGKQPSGARSGARRPGPPATSWCRASRPTPRCVTSPVHAPSHTRPAVRARPALRRRRPDRGRAPGGLAAPPADVNEARRAWLTRYLEPLSGRGSPGRRTGRLAAPARGHLRPPRGAGRRHTCRPSWKAPEPSLTGS